MVQKHRIATNIGKDQKVTVELKQDYDLLEILSLKFTQKEIYTSLCSDYGVLVGRITANNGFGVPNAKISIFVPLSDDDTEDPVISTLYPYQVLGDRNEDNYRYNLLPSRKQHSGHVPTGTFPDQSDILNREEVLEVYEKYYNYTVKTNDAGDFMIWGVPVGNQTIHVDVDLSDMGCFSLRPYDFIMKGVSEEKFDRYYNFKSSSDIDGLPQIITFEKTIEVYPFWGNTDLCEIGITRTDFDLSERGIEIQPIALILASNVTDENSHAIKRTGKIRRESGYKCNLQTAEGEIECVRFTGKKVYSRDKTKLYPELEYFEISESFDDSGSAMIVLPMNSEYVITNELGEQEITNDSNKGIPTTTISRFRFSLSTSKGKTTTANYLVPNIREFNPNTSTGTNSRFEYYQSMVSSYIFSDVFEDYLDPQLPSGTSTFNTSGYTSNVKSHKEDLILGNNGVPQDYFYKFMYGKVYTVTSFQGTHYEGNRRDSFLGIKEIRPNVESDCASKTNYIPPNFAFKNRIKFNIIISTAILFVQFILNAILIKGAELLGRFFWEASEIFYNIYFGWPFKWRPFEKFSEKLKDLAYKIQALFTQQLSLTIYPDCEECSQDDEAVSTDNNLGNEYCRVAEVKCKVTGYKKPVGFKLEWRVKLSVLNSTSSTNFSNSTVTGTTFLDNIFPYESARDGGTLCTTATTISYSNLPSLDGQTVTIPDDPNTARYFALIYPLVTAPGSTSFTDFLAFFSNGTDANQIEFINDGSSTYVEFTNDEWADLTGINYDAAEQNTGITDTNTYAVLRIYDRKSSSVSGVTTTDINIEEGCQKYDTVYNEDILYNYFWRTGSTYGSLTNPNSGNVYSDNSIESLTSPGPNYTIISSIIAESNTQRLPYRVIFNKIGNQTYDRRTRSGLSEIRDGVFTLIPVIQGKSNNLKALQEWYKRKRIGLFFCGGVVNYSFIDNWLNGMLYFFKFDKRIRWDKESKLDLNQRGSKFPRELIFYNIWDKKFYYRSTPYNGLTQTFIGQNYYLDGNKQILHPTTFYDVGVRDEFLKEICVDPRVDPACSVIRDIGQTSYQDPAPIVEYDINYRLDVANGKFDVDDFFDNQGYIDKMKILDGDLLQMFSINSEAGIEAFDTDSPYYFIYQGEYMDPENTYYKPYFTGGGSTYGPLPIDFKYDDNGSFIRSCLNYRLGDYSQTVPFYLWDKKGSGFGPYNSNQDKQIWDRTKIASMKLQRIFSVSSTTDTVTNYNFRDGEEEYLLPPMTITHNTFSLTGNTSVDSLERFDVIDTVAPSTSPNGALNYNEGNLWLRVTSGTTADPLIGTVYVVVNSTWTAQSDLYIRDYRENFIYQTRVNYTGNKQVLSTPFLFCFGLVPQKTSLDKLIKYFGPKEAFI
jgi:hypothetical protein